MNSGRVFLALGLIVAAATGGFIFMRHGTLRPESLPFAELAPPDLLLYAAVPDLGAFADSLADSSAFGKLGLDRALAGYRRARPRLAEIAGPSAALFVRANGSWVVLFRLRGTSPEPAGRFEALHWAAAGDVLAVSDSPEAASAALAGPHAPVDFANDRLEVCGAIRSPFAWIDLRSLDLPDIGGLALTATFDDDIRVRAMGNYYVGAKERVLAEFVHRPRVSPAPPPDAAAWISPLSSAPALWRRLLGSLTPDERALVDKQLERLAIEFLKFGSIESEVVARSGPDWGVALFEAPSAFGFARMPEGSDPILRRAVNGFAKLRRDRGLKPVAEFEGDRLSLPFLPESGIFEPAISFRSETMATATRAPLLEDPACRAFASPAPGEWHIGAGVDTAKVRSLVDELERRWGWKREADAVRAALDGAPWLRSADLRGRYTDRGLRIEATLR